MRLGLPLATREKELADLIGLPVERTFDLRFQGNLRTFAIRRIRIELPKYRLENGRTSAAQQDYIAQNKLASDYFDPSRSENAEVQKAQHAILKQMAAQSDAERNLFNFFANRDQEMPLVLDSTGFVVNGNRRLCTFREIHEQDPARFTHIDIIVLPKCDAKDIDELEAHLQVEKDIKQDYSWISLALTVRGKLNSKQYDEEQLCQIYDVTPKDLKAMIAELTLAEDYLSSRNKVGRYLDLEKTRFAFAELQKGRTKLSHSAPQQQFFSEIAYRLIDSPEGDRVYASIPVAREVLDDIRNAIEAEILPSQIAAKKTEIAATTEQDIFGATFVSDEEVSYLATFLALGEAKENAEIDVIIWNAIEAKKDRDRALKRGNSALEHIRKANTALNDAINLLAAQVSKEGMAEQLNSVERSITKIREWLKKDA